MKKLLLLATLLCATPAFGQSVQYVGPITPNHLGNWVKAGIMGDGGTSADSPVTSIGATGPICSNSGRKTLPGWNSICIQGNLNAPAVISVQNFGTATAQGINFNLNGTIVAVPTGGSNFIFGNGPFTSGDAPTFSGTSGLIVDSGVGMSGGVVNVGAWQATPVAIGFGGTGATTASAARTALGLGTIATQNANAVAITGGAITGMPTPLNATDVAIKSYVDAIASGLNILAPSTLATAAVLPNTPTYANGTLGVGATLTAGSNTTLTVDGTSAPLNTVVLVKNQASAFQNGIYTVTTAGSGSAAWVLTRATYFDQAAEMKVGSYTFITAGSTESNTAWTLQSVVGTVGTDALTFVQFSAAATGTVTSAAVTAGTGLSQSGTCNSTTVLNCTLTNTGVLSVGGGTGALTLGTGLVLSGSTINNTGVTSIGFANGGGGVSVTSSTTNPITTTGTITINVTPAAKADQIAAGSNALEVTPSVQQFHPSAAKAYAEIIGGTNTFLGGYNVASVSRTGVGAYTVNFITPFATGNASCVATTGGTASIAYQAATGASFVSLQALVPTSGAGVDPTVINLACFGGQ